MIDRSSTTDTEYDPYHKLLGISPVDQPPTAYRLLGIDLFESDREVIDGAANKQLSYLRDCCNGDHANAAEQLLNEVAEARLRLLNPASKESYDEELHAVLAHYQQAAETVAYDSPPEPPVQPAPTQPAPVQVTQTDHLTPRTRKKQSSVFSLLLGIFAPSIAALAIGWKLGLIDESLFVSQKIPNQEPFVVDLGPSSQPEQPTFVPKETATPDEGATFEVPAQTNSTPPVATDRNAASPPLNTPSESVTAQVPAPTDDSPQESTGEMFFDINASADTPPSTVPDPKKQATLEKKERLEAFRSMGRTEEDLPTDSSGGVPATSSGGRMPVPENELQEARRVVQRALASQIRETETAHDKQHLASVCYSRAAGADSAGEQYVLLQLAKDNFLDASDCTGALLALDELESKFEVDLFDERVTTLTKLAPKLHHPSEEIAAADRIETAIRTAMDRDDYHTVVDLAATGKRIAKEFRNLPMSKKFDMYAEKSSVLLKAQPMVQAARERLKSEPDNAKATEYLARFLCFGKSDWEAGLPLLQRSRNPTLAGLAKAEMRNPTSALASNELGNLWWELAAVSDRDAVLALEGQRRAAHWYREALASGLRDASKDNARSRLAKFESENADEIDARFSPNIDMRKPSPPRGVPETAIHYDGNWYLFSSKKAKFAEAAMIANQAGGHLVVIRSKAENDFILEHAKPPFLLGMYRKGSVWYDSLGEKQHFFLWDTRQGQPQGKANEPLAAFAKGYELWHDYVETATFYFAIEWGKD